MIHPVEYRSVIKFLIKKGCSSGDIVAELQCTYETKAPSKATIYNWIREFRNGRQSVFDEEKPGRPQEIGSDKKDELIAIIAEKRKITQRELSENLSISKGTVQQLLTDLGIKKVACRFVPRLLTAEMRDRRKNCCQNNLEILNNIGQSFLNNIITEDETPLSLYIPESKRTSSQWIFPGESAPKKLRSSAIHRKCLMLSVFWDAKGVIKLDFTAGKLDAQYYSDLLVEARRLRRKPNNQPLFLLHDNAPIHTSMTTNTTINKLKLQLLQHPPYSPDLAPSDFYLFKHLKNFVRGAYFADKEQLISKVNEFFNGQSSAFYTKAFEELERRWRKCLDVDGGYIEK
mgnify:CR=1 FL=1